MNLQEVERYRPIPWGGLKLLLASLLPALFAAICLGLSLTDWEDPLVIVLGRVVGIMIIAIVTRMLLTERHSVISWFHDYWRRNVRGYDVCFWIREDEGVDPDVSIWVEEMRRPPYWAPCELNGRGKIFLRVPLGGWFRKRGQLFRIEASESDGLRRAPFRAWRIVVREPITDPLVGACIEVIDGKGDRVPLTVSETLRFAAWIMRGGGIQEWRHEVPDLLRAVRESRAELAEVRRERDEARLQLKDAIAQIVGTVDHLDATKRFIKSKQAQEIRRGLVCELERLLPQDDPRRKKYSLAVTARCTADSQPAAVT